MGFSYKSKKAGKENISIIEIDALKNSNTAVNYANSFEKILIIHIKA